MNPLKRWNLVLLVCFVNPYKSKNLITESGIMFYSQNQVTFLAGISLICFARPWDPVYFCGFWCPSGWIRKWEVINNGWGLDAPKLLIKIFYLTTNISIILKNLPKKHVLSKYDRNLEILMTEVVVNWLSLLNNFTLTEIKL